ncbi:unnamed protein product [Phytomonas sp. Hart1]|nr:unnamed protein product [Phytomonas sp. Hart1]|eukprot:CCW71961.1 unnamed protein product [Phytomonas sp. isolate Hart1]
MLTMERGRPANAAGPPPMDPLDGVSLLITRRSEPDGMDSLFCRASSASGGGLDSAVFAYSHHLCVEVKLEPGYSPYYIIPRLDPGEGRALQLGPLPEEQLRFVLAILSSRPVYPGVFDVNFQEIPSSCEVFCSNPKPSFCVNPCRVVKTTYQYPTYRGVDTMERTCITPQGY